MDQRLSEALKCSNYMATFATQRRLLLEKFQEDLVLYKNGCEILVTETLISFCNTLLQKGKSRTVLIDANNMPVQIDDLDLFLQEILEIYATASNKYFSEYEKLKKNRSIEGILDL